MDEPKVPGTNGDGERALALLEKYYEFVTERYLEGTSRFHNVINYFLVAEALLFSLFGGLLQKAPSVVQCMFAIVGFVFSAVWLLILFRIEHVRDLRKRQGKQIEDDMEREHGVRRFVFRKEEYDAKVGVGARSSRAMRAMQNLQVSRLGYTLPLLFAIGWVVFFFAMLLSGPVREESGWELIFRSRGSG